KCLTHRFGRDHGMAFLMALLYCTLPHSAILLAPIEVASICSAAMIHRLRVHFSSFSISELLDIIYITSASVVV
ncbi:hypothetical protein V8E53_006103, partial [Lactarius tabidus]